MCVCMCVLGEGTCTRVTSESLKRKEEQSRSVEVDRTERYLKLIVRCLTFYGD